MADQNPARAAWKRLRLLASGEIIARVYPEIEPANKLDCIRADVRLVLDAVGRSSEPSTDQVEAGVKAWLGAPSTMEIADQVRAVYRAMQGVKAA